MGFDVGQAENNDQCT